MLVDALAAAFAARDTFSLQRVLTPMEKWKRDALAEILQSWLELTEQALACRTGGVRAGKLARTIADSRSSSEIMAAVKALNKALDYCRSNVSPGAVCGWLQWALR